MEDVVILCPESGARLRERTEAIPKPLVEIGGRPILCTCSGPTPIRASTASCLPGSPRRADRAVRARRRAAVDVTIECVDTGEATATGGRIAGVR
jgi:hypothetical protein